MCLEKFISEIQTEIISEMIQPRKWGDPKCVLKAEKRYEKKYNGIHFINIYEIKRITLIHLQGRKSSKLINSSTSFQLKYKF